MNFCFYLLAGIAIASALAAIRLPNLVHAVLSLMLFFSALAGIFILLLAEFIGAVQILVYVGAVGILVLFAIMLTRGVTGIPDERIESHGWTRGFFAAAAVLFGLLLPTIKSIPQLIEPPYLHFEPSVKDLGKNLMWPYVATLEVMALLLTAALISAVAVAMILKNDAKNRSHSPKN